MAMHGYNQPNTKILTQTQLQGSNPLAWRIMKTQDCIFMILDSLLCLKGQSKPLEHSKLTKIKSLGPKEHNYP